MNVQRSRPALADAKIDSEVEFRGEGIILPVGHSDTQLTFRSGTHEFDHAFSICLIDLGLHRIGILHLREEAGGHSAARWRAFDDWLFLFHRFGVLDVSRMRRRFDRHPFALENVLRLEIPVQSQEMNGPRPGACKTQILAARGPRGQRLRRPQPGLLLRGDGDLSRLGNGERNLPQAKARRVERAGASESII